MDWKKSLFVVMLLGITVFAMGGCGKTEEPAPVPMPEGTRTTPATTPAGTGTAPPITPTDNGTAPAGGMPSLTLMDLAGLAAKLGVTEQQLREALGDIGQKPLDLAAAAKKLGISEQSLREALGLPADGGVPTPGVGGPPPGTAGPRQ